MASDFHTLVTLFANDLITPTVEASLEVPPEGLDVSSSPIDFNAKNRVKMKRCKCGKIMYYTEIAPICGC